MTRSIVVLVDDLFFRAKIDHAGKSAGVPIAFVTDPADVATALAKEGASALFVDLAMRKEPFEAIRAAKEAAATKDLPVVGFFDHVRKDLHDRGKGAGCDRVLPRSAFSEHLGDLVLEFGLPGAKLAAEEEENPEE